MVLQRTASRLINLQKSQFCAKSLNHTSTGSPRRKFHSYKDKQHSWSVLHNIYKQQTKSTGQKYSCLLLNVDSNTHDEFARYSYLWKNADLKVAVDGSANYLDKINLVHTSDIVCGDFDSIDPKLLDQLRAPAGLKEQQNKPLVVETPDQNQTDFTKAIRVSQVKRPDITFFFALYNNDGSRLDHIFGQINTLHLIKRPIVLVNIGSDTVSWLLNTGEHVINKPKGRELCSLVPFSGSSEVKTKGLKYNLKPSTKLQFGGLVSTSNICRDDCEQICIETNRDILWSIDILL